MCAVCAQIEQNPWGDFGFFFFPQVDLLCLGENLMEEAGMKTIETNNIPLNRIGDGFSGLGGYTSCTSFT